MVLRLNFQHMEEEREGRLPTQHQAIFRHQQGILQFNLILALSNPETASASTGCGLSPTRLLPPLHIPIETPSCHLFSD